jgi:threonine/homoserine/homoserine lactone efflux protein
MTSILSLVLFFWVGAVTPGPVNFVSLSSSLNFGWRNTWLFVFGASIAYAVVAFVVGIGFGQLFIANKYFQQIVAWVGGGYLLYIAYRIAVAVPQEMNVDRADKPPSFVSGALMQWLNPKAWLFASSGIGLFFTDQSNFAQSLIIFCLFALIICFIGVSTWMFAGHLLKKILSKPEFQIWLNRTLALILGIVVVSIISTQ